MVSLFSMYKEGALSVKVLSPIPWRLRAIRKNAIIDSLQALDPNLFSSLKDYEEYFVSGKHLGWNYLQLAKGPDRSVMSF